MKKFQLITNKDCPKCDILIKWLRNNKVPFEEWSVEDKKIKNKLLNDSEFTKTYCDIESCMMYLPAIRIDKTGEYYFRDVIDFESFYVLKELLEIP